MVRRRSSTAFLLLLVLACSSPTETLEGIEQDFLFEVEYVNYSWGVSWVGLVIDRAGAINAYDHSHGNWVPADAESYTEGELNDKYEHGSRYIGSLEETTLLLQYGKIADIDATIPDVPMSCADAGQLTYRAFRYSSASATYSPVVLREEGDAPGQNPSVAAESLAEWLRTLILTLEDPGLAPFTEGSCTP